MLQKNEEKGDHLPVLSFSQPGSNGSIPHVQIILLFISVRSRALLLIASPRT